MWWKFSRHKLAVASLVILGFMYVGVIFAEFVSPYDPTAMDKTLHGLPAHAGPLHRRRGAVPPPAVRLRHEGHHGHAEPQGDVHRRHLDEVLPAASSSTASAYKLWGLFAATSTSSGPPSRKGRVFLFGADRQGRDMLSRIIYGSRISLSVPFVGIAFTFVLGILIGGHLRLLRGHHRHGHPAHHRVPALHPVHPAVDGPQRRPAADWSVTKIYFAIVIILSLVGWTGLARVVRGKFMAVKAEDFVMAAELDGVGTLRMIFRYLLPSFMSYIIASSPCRSRA